jgi:hypothetical protein
MGESKHAKELLSPYMCTPTHELFVSFEAFTEVMFQVKVFWVVILCSVVVGHKCFRRSMLPPSSGPLKY